MSSCGAQEKYNFKAHTFHAAGFASRDEYRAAHGSDLYMTDIEEYDRICKVSVMMAHELLQVKGSRAAMCFSTGRLLPR